MLVHPQILLPPHISAQSIIVPPFGTPLQSEHELLSPLSTPHLSVHELLSPPQIPHWSIVRLPPQLPAQSLTQSLELSASQVPHLSFTLF